MKKILLILLFGIYCNCFSQNWVTQYTSATKRVYDIFFLNASTGWAALDSGCVLKTTNGGQNWDTYNTGIGKSFLKICFSNANTGWAAVFYSQSFGYTTNQLYKTTNGGVSWNFINTASAILDAQSIIAVNSDTVVISGGTSGGKGTGSGGGLYRTYNGGTNFVSTTFNGSANRLQILNNSLWFWQTAKSSSNKKLVTKSTNFGNSWSNFAPNGDTNIYTKDFYFLNENTGYILASSPSPVLLYKTTNGGVNWTSNAPPTGNAVTFQFINENTGWIPELINIGGNIETRIHKTTNSGANWYYTVVNSGTYAPVHHKIYFLNEFTGWICGGSGLPYSGPNKGIIMKTTNGGVTFVNQTSSNIPDKYSLYQNYLNPFNPNTVISYQLPDVSYISLKVYDALGNEVETLVNEKQNPGSYSVDFNAGSLPSGIYFYKLVTEKFSETKKMILVK